MSKRSAAALALLLGFYGIVAPAQNNTIKATVSNETRSRLSVFIDNQFKCDLGVDASCSFSITKGAHLFDFRLSDGRFISDQNRIPDQYPELCIALTEQKVEYDDCELF